VTKPLHAVNGHIQGLLSGRMSVSRCHVNQVIWSMEAHTGKCFHVLLAQMKTTGSQQVGEDHVWCMQFQKLTLGMLEEVLDDQFSCILMSEKCQNPCNPKYNPNIT